MLKKLFAILKSAWILAAPITHNRLMGLGFQYVHPFYMMGDLSIELDIEKNKFYFINEEGDQKQIKFMRDIAGLIYGQIDYGQ